MSELIWAKCGGGDGPQHWPSSISACPISSSCTTFSHLWCLLLPAYTSCCGPRGPINTVQSSHMNLQSPVNWKSVHLLESFFKLLDNFSCAESCALAFTCFSFCMSQMFLRFLMSLWRPICRRQGDPKGRSGQLQQNIISHIWHWVAVQSDPASEQKLPVALTRSQSGSEGQWRSEHMANNEKHWVC